MASFEKQIDDLLNKLQNWEDIDPLYLGEETRDIRHKILHVFARTEISLEILLANHLLETVDNKYVSNDERISFKRRFTIIIAYTDFSKKLKSVQEASLLNKDIVGKIYKLNDLRIVFTHPSAYQDEIRKYSDNTSKKLEALQILEAVYEGLNEVFAKSMGMTKEQRNEFEKNS